MTLDTGPKPLGGDGLVHLAAGKEFSLAED